MMYALVQNRERDIRDSYRRANIGHGRRSQPRLQRLVARVAALVA